MHFILFIKEKQEEIWYLWSPKLSPLWCIILPLREKNKDYEKCKETTHAETNSIINWDNSYLTVGHALELSNLCSLKHYCI